jgi:hypothetical protein
MTMFLEDEPGGMTAPTAKHSAMADEFRVGSKEPAVVGDVVHVVVRLVDGDRVMAGSFTDPEEAHRTAKELQSSFAESDTGWPLMEGRYLRPQAVVSIDLVEEEHRRWGGSTERAKIKDYQGPAA